MAIQFHDLKLVLVDSRVLDLLVQVLDGILVEEMARHQFVSLPTHSLSRSMLGSRSGSIIHTQTSLLVPCPMRRHSSSLRALRRIYANDRTIRTIDASQTRAASSSIEHYIKSWTR